MLVCYGRVIFNLLFEKLDLISVQEATQMTIQTNTCFSKSPKDGFSQHYPTWHLINSTKFSILTNRVKVIQLILNNNKLQQLGNLRINNVYKTL